MKKEILELVVLGLRSKGLLSTENIVNALASLSEEQQHQWIETMLPNNRTNNSATCVLKVTPSENVSKLEIIAYVKRLLACSLEEAKYLVFRNETFELILSEPHATSAYEKLKDLHCNVMVYRNAQGCDIE